jgi:hypothetical protein
LNALRVAREDALPIWTVYRHPTDAPGMYVARMWLETRPTLEKFEAPTLEEVRAMLPPGLHRLERHPQDDPVIVETWI